MSLNPRAIATQGLGYGAELVAVQGLAAVAAPPPGPPDQADEALGDHAVRVRRARRAADFWPDWMPEHLRPRPRRSRRRRRAEDALLLG